MCTARDLMSSPAATVQETASFEEVLSSVVARGVPEVYVLDREQRLLGIVTDYDLLKARLAQLEGSTPVDQLMCRNVASTRPDVDVREITPAFRDCSHREVTVIDEGRLIGVIRRQDILLALVWLEKRADFTPADERPRVRPQPVRPPKFAESLRIESLAATS